MDCRARWHMYRPKECLDWERHTKCPYRHRSADSSTATGLEACANGSATLTIASCILIRGSVGGLIYFITTRLLGANSLLVSFLRVFSASLRSSDSTRRTSLVLLPLFVLLIPIKVADIVYYSHLGKIKRVVQHRVLLWSNQRLSTHPRSSHPMALQAQDLRIPASLCRRISHEIK